MFLAFALDQVALVVLDGRLRTPAARYFEIKRGEVFARQEARDIGRRECDYRVSKPHGDETVINLVGKLARGHYATGPSRSRGGEAFEAIRELITIRPPGHACRQDDGLTVERLQQIEHRPIFVVQQTSRDVDLIIGRDADQILVEGSVMN